MSDGPVAPTPAAHLQRQLQFLRKSAEAFDQGHLAEAVRIATAARIILHQTSRSTSLLHQLGADSIPLLTTSSGPLVNSGGPNPWDGMSGFSYDGAALFQAGPSGTYYGPKLGGGPPAGELPAPDWWRQVVFALDPSAVYSRRDVILGAANQDGGAHVDPVLDAKYEQMAYTRNYGFLVSVTPGGEVQIPLHGYRPSPSWIRTPSQHQACGIGWRR